MVFRDNAEMQRFDAYVKSEYSTAAGTCKPFGDALAGQGAIDLIIKAVTPSRGVWTADARQRMQTYAQDLFDAIYKTITPLAQARMSIAHAGGVAVYFANLGTLGQLVWDQKPTSDVENAGRDIFVQWKTIWNIILPLDMDTVRKIDQIDVNRVINLLARAKLDNWVRGQGRAAANEIIIHLAHGTSSVPSLQFRELCRITAMKIEETKPIKDKTYVKFSFTDLRGARYEFVGRFLTTVHDDRGIFASGAEIYVTWDATQKRYITSGGLTVAVIWAQVLSGVPPTAPTTTWFGKPTNPPNPNPDDFAILVPG